MPFATLTDTDPAETQDWIDSLRGVAQAAGVQRAQYLLARLIAWGQQHNIVAPFTAKTPYVNTIPPAEQPAYPGDREIERRIKSYVRWNAMAMVVRANRRSDGIGGHISTYASAATLLEVGFNHFFRGCTEEPAGDQVFFQGHAAPGIYARAYLEHRLHARQLRNFRRELADGGGLSSYPHPWLMPDFWQFPTVSMGLGPINAIYQARFNRYLHDRGLTDTSACRVWAFLGDGEMDEPESLGAITLAAREELDNLTLVINCNLQRLDGPVRGNGNIIQELEGAFRGAGWNVIKVIWGEDWDPLLAADTDGALVDRMNQSLDGELQKYTVESGAYIREKFFGTDRRLLKLVEHLSDEQLQKLRLGGHDPEKVHAAYRAAVEHRGRPTVILARTIKGYGLGEAGEGRNITHQQKKLDFDELRHFRDRFNVPIPDDQLEDAPFYRPGPESREYKYLMERRAALGGFVPRRQVRVASLPPPERDLFEEFLTGSGDREASTTMALVRMLGKLLGDPALGKYIVPIVPDEARTFGLEGLFRKYAIYAHRGQRYEPVDSHLLLYYRESQDGQILEEGITEAGSMASFTAAGTAGATHGVPTIPFYLFYSMFGFQRIGDFAWACGDARARGFLVGCTSGRTTLAGEGLQHQDGHSHLLGSTIPNLVAYDPAFAFEIALIVRDGIRRMFQEREPVFYYLTVGNEPYAQPPMPAGVEEGVLRGLYKYRPADHPEGKARVHLLGSGAILREALKAQKLLAEQFNVAANVWSATSYLLLRREALACERWNLLHPGEPPRVPYVTKVLSAEPFPVIATSDYMRAVPDMIARWVPSARSARPDGPVPPGGSVPSGESVPLGGGFVSLGTDGFGRSEARAELRDYFEIDARYVALAALRELARLGQYPPADLPDAVRAVGLDPNKPDPTQPPLRRGAGVPTVREPNRV
ncbi:MAG TPA: pyruvate dehydrogenase (acetyl-transferring), homodimeric type [Phycisphaerae bacterium]|nr:pyruvate dehydrogenase (acetyl-transferring), homodimeric type [Phycisphaerae bacterium]HNU44618.1 pyruvate dehydrogenase (acetyl-transferring), homodimeric type [Phycisphaerae bacterium]